MPRPRRPKTTPRPIHYPGIPIQPLPIFSPVNCSSTKMTNTTPQKEQATVGEAKVLTPEEIKKIHDEIVDGHGDVEDEFQDAAEEEDSEEVNGANAVTFDVTDEELAKIRSELAEAFPDDYEYLSDAYVLSVASKPYSKDPTVRRPLDYTLEKLKNVMTWREGAGAPDMEDLIRMAQLPETDPKIVEDPEKYVKVKALATSLNAASSYWHGLTKDGKPILWVRTDRKPWYPDADAEVNALIALADAGIRAMPKDTTDFVVLSDSNAPPPPHPTFMINMLKALVRGYPDRLAMLISAPVGSVIQFVMNLLLPLMPGRLSSKVVLIGAEDVTEKLGEILLNGKDDIPTFFGGPVDHDKLYPPEESLASSWLMGGAADDKPGILKFDYFGMVERLEKEVKDYEEKKSSE